MSAIKHVVIGVIWAINTVGLFAQNYPIQATVQLLPPYTPRITELQSDPNRLSVTLLNKDLATPVVDVYLKLQLQGPGVGLQTRSGYRPIKTFTLNAGVPIRINGPDMAELLQPQNLDFQGLDRNAFIRGGQLLPEGLWTISISAYSVTRNLQVSNTGVVMAGLFKHKPPLLNFPFHESRAGSALPQFLPFQWTSRHYASPFAAGSIRYRFKMIELIPGNRNPNEAMLATAIPWFETFTDQTSYLYGPADPPLVPGRSYAWQVQAIDVDGSEGFENEGYSQVFSFVFGETCAAPLGIRARAEEGRTIRVSWTPIPGIANAAYGLWYRTKGIGEWQTFMVTDTVATVGGLLPNTEYEVYVNRICIGGESPPTATISVTTDASRGAWDEVSKQCGKPAPTFDLSNRQPLLSLEPGETFTAADFTIKVLSATGENGEFSGSGTVWLPFTGKVPIPCTWENVSINSDRRLVDGMVKILRKPLVLSNLTFEKLADRWRDLFGSNWNRSEYKRITVPVSDVEVLPDGRIRIRTAKGDEFARGGQNTVIEGPDGKRWYVSAGGKVTGPEGPPEKPVVGNESNGAGMPGSVLPDGTMVLFDNDDPNRRAWDAYNIRSQTGGSSYDRLDGPPGGYMAGWKLLATGEKETVRATLRKGKLKLHPDSFRFLRSDGVRIKSERINDTVWKLELPGRLHLWADAVWAVGSIVPPDSVRGGSRRILGKLNLIAADERKVHVKLVPVGGSGGSISKGQLETALDAITGKFGVKAGVEVVPSMAVSGYNPQVDKISVNRMALKTSYGSDLQRFIREYEGKYRSPRSDTAVMFLLGPAADHTEGYMALNNRYGFIFCGNSPPEAHTLAHELGHGLLVLEHPFEESAEQVGKTLNLMDYRKPHALTHFQQWKRIHDKEEVGNFLRGVRQKEEEGRYVTLRSSELLGFANPDSTFTCINPVGNYIKLPAGSDNFIFSTYDKLAWVTDNEYQPRTALLPLGCLIGFNVGEKIYTARFNDSFFRGYYCVDGSWYTHKPNGVDSLTYTDYGIGVFISASQDGFVTHAGRFKSALAQATGSYAINTIKPILSSPVVFAIESNNEINETEFIALLNIKAIGELKRISGNWYPANFNIDSIYLFEKAYTAEQFITTYLAANATLNDYLTVFAYCNLSTSKFKSLKACISRFKYVSDTIYKTIKVANKTRDYWRNRVYVVEAQHILERAFLRLNIINTLVDLLKRNAEAAEISDKLKSQDYDRCALVDLDITYRIALYNKLFEDEDYWSFDNQNILKDLLGTCPERDLQQLYLEGFCKNDYQWLREIWDDGEIFESRPRRAVFNAMIELFVKLEAEREDRVSVRTELKFIEWKMQMETTQYIVAIKEYYLGLSESNILRIGTQDLHGVGSGDSAKLCANGKVYLYQEGYVREPWPEGQVISSKGYKPYVGDIEVLYADSLWPLELINVTVCDDGLLGGELAKGAKVSLPAIMVCYLERLRQYELEYEEEQETKRILYAAVEVAATAAIGAVTGGIGGAILGAALAVTDIAVTEIDREIEVAWHQMDAEEREANELAYGVWRVFSTGWKVVPLLHVGKSAVKGLVKYAGALRFRNQMNSFALTGRSFFTKISSLSFSPNINKLSQRLWRGANGAGSLMEMPANFFENVNDLGSTFDQFQKLSSTVRGEIYNFYKQQKWDKIEALFKEYKLNGGWPPANGGFNIVDDVLLTKGMKFDRYQEWFKLGDDGNPILGGSFTSPINGTPYSYTQRALRVAENQNPLYYEIEVLKDLPIKGQSADVIPWFNQVGNGKQMMFKFQPKGGTYTSFQDLIDGGYIKVTIKSSPNGQYTNWVGRAF